MKKAIYLLLALFIFSCGEDDQQPGIKSIEGVIQKGPFASGTNVTIYELDQFLVQTGKTFNTITLGNKGKFDFPDVALESDFVELIADGSFFNEVKGNTPDSKIILRAVSLVRDSKSVNVNLLTTLSVERIKFLVQSEGLLFEDARFQAENEILNIFGFESVNNQNFEDYDFSEVGVTSNQLLAISGIILGIKNNQELTEFLTEFAFDIRADGSLDEPELIEDLSTSGITCPVGQIRANLSDFYNDGSTYTGFQEYVEDFKAIAAPNSAITLNPPSTTSFGINLLPKLDMEVLDTSEVYCFSQNLVGDNPNIDNIYYLTIYVAKVNGTGTYKIQKTSEFDNWSHYPNSDLFLKDNVSYKGDVLTHQKLYESPENSKTPTTITFEGEGELVVRFEFQIGIYPYGESLYTIDKYFMW